MILYFSRPLEQQHIAQVYASKQKYISKMNGLYSQAILQQQAMNAVKTLKPNTTVVDKTPEKSTIPNIYTNTSTVSTSTSSSSSSGSIFSTISTDFSKYFDYILIGGIVIFVFYMFSGSSSKPQKYVDIEIPE